MISPEPLNKSKSYIHQFILTFLTGRKLGFVNVNIKIAIYKKAIKIALIYRQPNSQLRLFYDLLYMILEQQVNILLGDFSIDAIDNNNNTDLQDILRSYQLVVDKPTHLCSSLLDHVYVKQTFLDLFTVRSIVNS